MAGHNKQITGELAKEYCKRFQTSATREIARALITDHPECFRDIEHARSVVRYYRGALGDTKRKDAKEIIPRVIIPKADKQSDFTPYRVTEFPIAVCGDMHMPYHDEQAIQLFIDHCYKIQPKTILLAGDNLDCYQVSRWNKNPKMRDFPSEVAMMKGFLRSLHEAFPEAKIVYKVGNHEERYEKYLMEHAPALFGMDEITLKNLIGATEDWIDYVDNKRVITAKKLNIIHGHEYTFAISNPVNPARGLYTRAKKNAMCFHFHQTSEHSETAINGDLTTCWSVGCLCQIHCDYMPLNRWNHGFADIFIDGDIFTVHNYRILNGRIL
jgi:predicted phosphodiesterase